MALIRTWKRLIIDAILEERPYPLKMLVVQSGNPAVTMTDSNRVLKALDKLEFMVVIDLFMTRTGEFADVILPASSCFEKTQLNRAYTRHNTVKIQTRVIDPLGDSWPDWKIIFELGRRLGLEREFPWQTAEEVIDYQLEPAGITVDMLRKSPDGISFEDIRYEKYKTGGLATPSGKMEFYSKKLKDNGFSPVPCFDGDAGVRSAFMIKGIEFPFVGISGARFQLLYTLQFRKIPSLLKREPKGLVDIHPDDAKRRGFWMETG